MAEKISLVTFTDPMMGLSYECAPIFRKLETHFADEIEFHFVMSLLVRDVYELFAPDDLKLGKATAIKITTRSSHRFTKWRKGSAVFQLTWRALNFFPSTKLLPRR